MIDNNLGNSFFFYFSMTLLNFLEEIYLGIVFIFWISKRTEMSNRQNTRFTKHKRVSKILKTCETEEALIRNSKSD